jgi:exodeoxyribonuclease VII small subunit
MSEEVTFESALRSLEDIVEKLESGELPLEEALSCFEEGVRSASFCQKRLKAVEAKVETLLKSQEGVFSVEPFKE